MSSSLSLWPFDTPVADSREIAYRFLHLPGDKRPIISPGIYPESAGFKTCTVLSDEMAEAMTVSLLVSYLSILTRVCRSIMKQRRSCTNQSATRPVHQDISLQQVSNYAGFLCPPFSTMSTESVRGLRKSWVETACSTIDQAWQPLTGCRTSISGESPLLRQSTLALLTLCRVGLE